MNDSHESAQPVVYRIDAGDTIRSVNGAWRAFARENGAPALADGAVGRSIWDFVGGHSCIHLWQVLVQRARDGEAVAVPYRCDAASWRRRMQMTLRAFDDGSVEFVSSVLTLERREPIPQFELLRACSWCNRFFDGAWLEPEAAVARLGLLEAEPSPITHGMCPDCETRVLAGLAPAEA